MSLLPFDLPPAFLAAARSPEWAAWVDGVPRTVRDLLDEWDLVVDGEPMHGWTSLVVPVRTDERAAVLKVAWPYEECQHEILALQHWHGRGAVRLLRADPRRNAMLLERLSTRDLTQMDVVEACEVIAGLYARLHVPAPPQMLTLSSYIRRYTDDLERLPKDAAIPRRIVDQAVRVGRELSDDPASDGTLIHGDLHFENVLAGEREPWLAIDPQPVSGDPHYEVAMLLFNRWDEIVASGDVREAVRRRFHAAVDVAGLDEDRARDWVVVREAHNAMWAIEDGDDPDRVTTAITIIKAVQD
ncbi:aminoglycoside phosphotransferase family protein [Aeromicrobium sp. 9AM]|uniref:aminoglycoside phosphotransferase family protein n=1 Tax=Aeromicrobium sp. 9AM TaxID=2653126 RepID=UPI0012F0381D|nr:aminoglycoside phosphotransferase family protein [Aeromicrobium sp. 9AM]VXB09514.1 Streptomycin 6-kinase [Aeromicrobium sp. 9AM]